MYTIVERAIEKASCYYVILSFTRYYILRRTIYTSPVDSLYGKQSLPRKVFHCHILLVFTIGINNNWSRVVKWYHPHDSYYFVINTKTKVVVYIRIYEQ